MKLLSCGLPGITVCAVSSLLLVGADPLPAADLPKPNVIVVLADDLGWLDTTPYGSRYYETPSLERLAARGLRFTEAYAASPLCSPTRASLLTGQWPGRLRLTTPACHFPHYVKATFNLPCTWVRKGDWKLFRFFCDNDDQSDRFELYNLRDDIGETNNLAAEMPELTRQLNDLITAHLADSASLVPKKNPGYGKHPPAGWSTSKHASIEKRDGRLVVTSTGGDPWMLTREVPKNASGKLRVELRMKTDAGNGSITWATRESIRLLDSTGLLLKQW